MAGTVSQEKVIPLAGGASLVSGKLTMSNLAGASVAETYAVSRLKAGDPVMLFPGDLLAAAFVTVHAEMSADGVLTQGFAADDPAGTEVWYFVGIASV